MSTRSQLAVKSECCNAIFFVTLGHEMLRPQHGDKSLIVNSVSTRCKVGRVVKSLQTRVHSELTNLKLVKVREHANKLETAKKLSNVFFSVHLCA